MLILGIILSAFGIGFFCWLLFTLAVYALPFFAAMDAGLAAFQSGAGVIGAIFIGMVAGIAILVVGQVAFAVVQLPIIRTMVALVFAAPAAIAGYQATFSLSRIAVPSHRLGEAFAVIGAMLVGATAWARITLFADPPGTTRLLSSGSAQTALGAVSRDG